ncbi:MAG: hypothetical protein M3O55_09955 [Actinomycetota bacterium]|nr:hypothetical protein [Actinomycetota bacterium]
MAKALFGHVTPGPDVRLLDEVGRLRRRVQELEQELSATRADNDRLAASMRVDDDILRLSHLEHASI